MFCYLFIVMVEHSVHNFVESKPNIVEFSNELKISIFEASVELKPNIVKASVDLKSNVDSKDNIVDTTHYFFT